MIARVGSILKGFTVTRRNGKVERYDKPIHNYISPDHFTTSFFGNGTAGETFGAVRYMALCEHRSSYLLSGIGGGAIGFNPTTKVLSNIDVFNNFTGFESTAGMIVLETGEFAYITSGNDGTGILTLSNNLNNTSVTGKRIYQFSGSSSVDRATSAAAAARSASYSNGVITSVNTQPQVITLTSNKTIRSIRFAFSGTQNISSDFSIFDLPTPLNLLAGDTVAISPGDYVTTFSFDDYQPRTFTALNCPIAGISASGRYQRLIPAFGSSGASLSAYEGILNANDTRMWLISDANKITIPNYQQTALLDETLIVSPIETIVPMRSYSPLSASNDFVDTIEMWGSVLTGGTVKQIIGGRTASGQPLGWVVEFDTPQVIPPGKVLYFKAATQVIPDIVVPTFTANP